jgi:hypothetical protein
MSDDTTKPSIADITEALKDDSPPTFSEIGEAIKADAKDSIEKFGARRIVKGVAQFIVGASVGFTTKKIIENNVEVEKKREKAEVYIGSAAMAASASKASRTYLDSYIDTVFDIVERTKKSWVNADPK